MLLKIGTQDLKIGMFVSELDRPWIDTPFLIQGFLIDNPVEINSLRLYCQYVYVDAFRSAAGVLPEVRPEKRTIAHNLRPHQQGASRGVVVDLTNADPSHDKLSDTTRFMRMAEVGDDAADDGYGSQTRGRRPARESVWWRLRRIFGWKPPQPALPPPTHFSFIPADIQLVAHGDSTSLGSELGQAFRHFEAAKYSMNRVVADVLAEKKLVLTQLWDTINAVVDSVLRNGDAMMWVAMTTPQEATIYGHGVRTAVHLSVFGKSLGLPKIHLTQLAMVGVLLDIGKTALPLRVLTKPERLTDEEFTLVKEHVTTGLELIAQSTPLHDDIVRAIAEHHEREDGSGYPKGLPGDQIGLFGRMAAIVDTFVALTDERPYAELISPYVALRRLTEWTRSLFHPPLVEQYIQAIGVFPVGSLVELSTEEVAVIIHPNRNERLKPQVMIVAGADKVPLSNPVFLDLAAQKLKRDAPAPVTISGGLPAGSYGIDDRYLRLVEMPV